MITAIITAAGRSSRMPDKNKLLLPLGGYSLIEQVLDRLLAVPQINKTIIVVPSGKMNIQEVVKNHPIGAMVLSIESKSLADSIIAGIQNAPNHSEGFMICLGDMPLVTSQEYETLASVFLQNIVKNPETILVPMYNGEWGHPRIFSAEYRNSILKQKGKNGLKDLIKLEIKNVKEIKMDSDNILRDIDTPDDYSRIKERFK
jgi:molybdenum cofactor cytidylyltransferase